MSQSNWIFAFASVIGNSHIAENLPCQDYCRVESFEKFSIAVVCDGAGSCKNSQIGSEKASWFCIDRFEKLIRDNKWDDSESLPAQEVWHNLAKQTLYSVREDLENYGINEELEFKSLSSTLILTIILENGLLVSHIGDGRAGYCDSSNDWLSSITPFHGEVANQTVFLTSDFWDEEIIDNYIESRVIADQVKAVCLMSDGCEKASFECNLFDSETETYYDPNKPYPLFFDGNIKILPTLYAQGKSVEEINEMWKEFLSNGNDRLKVETDDKTLILGVRIS